MKAKQPGFESPAVQAGRKALFACSPAARRAAKSVRKALLCRAAETDVHAAGFSMKIGEPRPSDTTRIFDRLRGTAGPLTGIASTGLAGRFRPG